MSRSRMGRPASSIVVAPSMNTAGPWRASRTRARRTLSMPSTLRVSDERIELAGDLRIEEGREAGLRRISVEHDVRAGTR